MMAPNIFSTVIAIINEQFDDVIDKKQLISALRTKQTELRKEIKAANANKPPSIYNVYVWEHLHYKDLTDLKPKERMSYISKQWKDETEKYKADKKGYNPTVNASHEERAG